MSDPSPSLPPPRGGASRRRRTRVLALKLGGVALGLLLLSLAWRFTPLREHLDPHALADRARSLRESPAGPLLVLAAHVVAGLLALPVTLLLLATFIAFGPVHGALYATLGCMANAIAGYYAGRWLGKGAREWLFRRFRRAGMLLSRHGTLSVALLRLVPVAPFSVMNLLAGALRVRIREYLLGTFLGMAPVILILALFTDRILAALEHPGRGSLLALLATGVLALIAARFLGRIDHDAATPGTDRMA